MGWSTAVFLACLAWTQSRSSLSEAEYLVETTVRVSSTGGGVVRASVPVPREWPEQRIEASAPEATRCKAKIEPAPPGAASLTFVTAPLRPKEEGGVVYRQRVFVRPQPRWSGENFPGLPNLDAKVKPFLLPTPTIDSRDPAICDKAAELCSGIEAPWEKARRLADWTFKHLDYQLMGYTSAKQAFDEKVGDCEERSALFVALCRSQGIPARTVVSPGKTRKDSGHCWSEILLADRDGKAEWLPVDVGLRWFGELPVAPLVLQKGDSYPKIGGGSGRQRLLGSWARGGSGQLTFHFEQEVTPVSANALLDPTAVKSPVAAPKP